MMMDSGDYNNPDKEETASESQEAQVEVFHRVNRLKKKAGGDMGAGAGYISKDAIDRANQVIADSEKKYSDEVKEVIDTIENAWNEALGSEGEECDDALEMLYHGANHIKDLASTFNYELMKHFGSSLRDFCEKVDINNKAHHIIVKAHIDVMNIAYNQGIKDHGGDTAEELKLFVAKAIEKYS